HRAWGSVVAAGVVAAAAACHNPDKYLPESPSNRNGTPVASILDIVAAAATLPADGASRTRITARIDAAATVRTVTFETSLGTLFAGGRNTGAATALPVEADDTGVAAVELQSAAQVATARVSATIRIPGTDPQRTLVRTVDVDFVPFAPGEIVTLGADASSAPADRATLTRLVATVAAHLPPGTARDVTFTTTRGEFAANADPMNPQRATVRADASNIAIVDLRSPESPGPASITATASNVTSRATVNFTRALPDLVLVQVAPTSIARVGANLVTVTVLLMRDLGQVSSNTVVEFEARDSAGDQIGTFAGVMLANPDTTDTAEFKRLKATVTFDPIDTAALGQATITARVGSVAGSATLQIN
ncbi:MAG: hypothetical protein ACRD26_17895, partial [Vicinamibacterales bacterium]